MEEPRIIELEEKKLTVGYETKTNSAAVMRDVRPLEQQFNRVKGSFQKLNNPLETVIVTTDFNPDTNTFKYFMGNVVSERFEVEEPLIFKEIPAGSYVHIELKSWISLLYPMTIIRAKRYLFNKWLPQSDYEHSGDIDDFEHHTQKSEKWFNLRVDYYVPVKKK